MNETGQYNCSCGAVGDLNSLIDHAREKFEMPEDTTDHVIAGVDEPAVITEARVEWQRTIEVRQQLEQVVGATVAEIRRALAG